MPVCFHEPVVHKDSVSSSGPREDTLLLPTVVEVRAEREDFLWGVDASRGAARAPGMSSLRLLEGKRERR